MSQEWGIYIAVIVILNIVGMIVLLKKTGVQSQEELDQPTTGHEWDGIQELNNPLPRWWLYLFYASIVFGFAYLLLYPGLGIINGYLGWTQVQQLEKEEAAYQASYADYYESFLTQTPEALAQNTKAMGTARNLFAQNCAACHGADAGGALGFPNLTDDDWLYGNTHDQIKQSIEKGRKGMMPPFGAVFNEADRGRVIYYIQSLSDPSVAQKIDQAELDAGKAKYIMCMGCHGPEAKGNPFMGAPNLTDKTWLYGGDFASIEHTLINGRQGNMPAHESILSPSKIHLLASYIGSLSEGAGK